MSLTFQVTIPVESLERIQNMSPFDNSTLDPWGEYENTEAVKDVLRCIVTALKDLPYNLVPKKANDVKGVSQWDDPIEWSSFETNNIPGVEKTDDEIADNASEEYDEIQTDELDAVPDTHRERGGDQADPCADQKEPEKSDADEDENPDERDSEPGDIEEAHNSSVGETPGDPIPIRHGCGNIENVHKSDEINAMLFMITVHVINTGERLRVTVYEKDTWIDLASRLKWIATTMNDDVTFQFPGGIFSGRGTQSLLMSGVRKDSVIAALSTESTVPTWNQNAATRSAAPQYISGHPTYDFCSRYVSPYAPPPAYPTSPGWTLGSAMVYQSNDDTMTITFRDVKNMDHRFAISPGASLASAFGRYQAMSGQSGEQLSWKTADGAMQVWQSPGPRSISIRTLGLKTGDIILVTPKNLLPCACSSGTLHV